MPFSQESFQDSVSSNVRSYALAMKNVLEAMFSFKTTQGEILALNDHFYSEKNFYVSILFTGTVYGEFILATSEETAAKILGIDINDANKNQIREEMSESFCELLNIVAGESIVGLNNIYKKLTITPPRVHFGSVGYPKVKMGKSILSSEHGSLECYLYIDRMQLDIASSYKEALHSVLVAHKELQNAMKRLQTQQSMLVQSEKMAALGTMAAGVAHEINTPLSTVSLVSSHLKQVVEADSNINRQQFLKSLDVIEKTVDQISKITTGMRTFAQQVTNDQFVKSSVNEIVENAIAIFDNDLKIKGVSFEFIPSAENPTIDCSPPEISQVIVSLVNNASDAVAEKSNKWIRIEVVNTLKYVEIRVTDSGKGVSPEIESKMFDPFFTTKDYGKGSGLGLSMAKGIIDRHAGYIGLDRSVPHTCFTVRLNK